MTEAMVQRDILRYLTVRGVPHARTNAGRAGGVRLAPEGWPDIVACYRGRFVAIECKRPGGVSSASQDAQHCWLRQNMAVVIVATSVEIVAKTLDGLTKLE